MAIGHTVTPGPIVRALAAGLNAEELSPAEFISSTAIGKALNTVRIQRARQRFPPETYPFAWWTTSALRERAEADNGSPSTTLLSSQTIVECLEAWGRDIHHSEPQPKIGGLPDADMVVRDLSFLLAFRSKLARRPFISPRCDSCAEATLMMREALRIVNVGLNDRAAAIAEDAQQAAAYFDLYDAVAFREMGDAESVVSAPVGSSVDPEIQRILDDNRPHPEHEGRRKATSKAKQTLREKTHEVVELINRLARQSLRQIPNETNAFWRGGPTLSLAEAMAEFEPSTEPFDEAYHDEYFQSLPQGSWNSGQTEDSKTRLASFPSDFDGQPGSPKHCPDDGCINAANRPHDRLASVFKTPILSAPVRISGRSPMLYC